jgi:hypothetical protein
MRRENMTGIKNARGVTYIGFLTIAVLGFFAILIVFRTAPAYIENYSIRDSLHSLQDKVTTETNPSLSKFSIYRALDRMFEVNRIHSITARDVLITPVNTGFAVQALYKVNVPLIGNLSLTIQFDNSVVVKENAS